MSSLVRWSCRPEVAYSCEQLAVHVELELSADPVPDDDLAAGVAGQVEGVFAGREAPVEPVGRGEPRAVLEDLAGAERDRLVHERVRK